MLGILACRISLSALHLKSLVHLTNVNLQNMQTFSRDLGGHTIRFGPTFFLNPTVLAASCFEHEELAAIQCAGVGQDELRLGATALSCAKFLEWNRTVAASQVLWQGDP